MSSRRRAKGSSVRTVRKRNSASKLDVEQGKAGGKKTRKKDADAWVDEADMEAIRRSGRAKLAQRSLELDGDGDMMIGDIVMNDQRRGFEMASAFALGAPKHFRDFHDPEDDIELEESEEERLAKYQGQVDEREEEEQRIADGAAGKNTRSPEEKRAIKRVKLRKEAREIESTKRKEWSERAARVAKQIKKRRSQADLAEDRARRRALGEEVSVSAGTGYSEDDDSGDSDEEDESDTEEEEGQRDEQRRRARRERRRKAAKARRREEAQMKRKQKKTRQAGHIREAHTHEVAIKVERELEGSVSRDSKMLSPTEIEYPWLKPLLVFVLVAAVVVILVAVLV